jgi:hypothetical protein
MTGTTEQLLSKLVEVFTPCPNICNGTWTTYGTTPSDIKTGLPIQELKEPPKSPYNS